MEEFAADALLSDTPAALPSSPGPALPPEALPNVEGDADFAKLPVVEFSEPTFSLFVGGTLMAPN